MRQVYGMGVREIKTKLKVDVEDVYSLDRYQILNLGKEFNKFSSVYAKTSVVRVWVTL